MVSFFFALDTHSSNQVLPCGIANSKAGTDVAWNSGFWRAPSLTTGLLLECLGCGLNSEQNTLWQANTDQICSFLSNAISEISLVRLYMLHCHSWVHWNICRDICYFLPFFLYFPKVWNSLILTMWLWIVLKPRFLGWAGREEVSMWEGACILSSAEHAEAVPQLLPNFIPLVRTVLEGVVLAGTEALGWTPLWRGTCPQPLCDLGWLCGNHQQGDFHLRDPSLALYESKWSNGLGGALLRWVLKPYLKTSYMK